MKYIKVYPTEVIQGFTDTSMFVLMLYDPMGNRKVPVMIGEHEAEMIILEQERRQARRPMTYELILSILDAFALTLKLVRIDRFDEGIFYATLVVSDGFNEKNIDARASDAVVLALHQSVDIEMAEQVVQDTSFTPQDNDIELGTTLSSSETIEDLEEELRQCEENEDYEQAEEIMKKIDKMRNMSQAELANEESKLRKELFNLRFQHVTGQLDNPLKMKEVKREIARVKTVMRENELKAVKE